MCVAPDVSLVVGRAFVAAAMALGVAGADFVEGDMAEDALEDASAEDVTVGDAVVVEDAVAEEALAGGEVLAGEDGLCEEDVLGEGAFGEAVDDEPGPAGVVVVAFDGWAAPAAGPLGGRAGVQWR